MHRIITAGTTPSRIYGHPTVKPAKVMDKIARNVAGGTICDPFMGTGSTGVAAIAAGKRFVGIEHNPRHFSTAVDRIAQAVAQLEVAA
jgi:DNA modification methylase